MLKTEDVNADVLKALNEESVDFLVIGGMAVKYYCPERSVKDLDVLLYPTLENGTRVVGALSRLGLTAHFDLKQIISPKQQMVLKHFHNADMITPDEDFDYLAAKNRSLVTTINGIRVHIVAVEDLIRMKSSTDRDLDIADIAILHECKIQPSAREGRS